VDDAAPPDDTDRLLSVAVPPDLDGERFDKVVAVVAGVSRAVARHLVEEERATLDGEARPPRWKVTAGERLEFRTPPGAVALEPEAMEIVTRYEDEHVLVVDKPPGLVVHPGAGASEGTLAAGLLARHPAIEGVGEAGRWGIVHRLDRDTSGLLVVALTSLAYEHLGEQLRNRAVHRSYLALVDGSFDVATGTIDAPIARDPARPTRRRVAPGGRPARTHYQVVTPYEEDGVTLVRVTLDTGRTHQIRVHMAAIGHPVAGDALYRPGPDRVAVPRLFLHATDLAFTHPVTGGRVEVSSPLPPDLTGALERLSRR
jgi:23S rRNA pseudouridine1911/1915/1917 synthase